MWTENYSPPVDYALVGFFVDVNTTSYVMMGFVSPDIGFFSIPPPIFWCFLFFMFSYFLKVSSLAHLDTLFISILSVKGVKFAMANVMIYFRVPIKGTLKNKKEITEAIIRQIRWTVILTTLFSGIN